LNYFEHHIGDYDADTAHLSWVEDMAYTRLMRLYYRKELPIPVDVAEACRLVRAQSREQRAAVESVLREFFSLAADGWHQKRCDADIGRYQKKVAHNQEVGKLGGRPKKSGTQVKPVNNPGGFPDEPKPNPLQSPDTNHSEAIASGGKPPADADPAELIFGRGVPMLTASGVSEKNARSMLGLMRKTHGDAAVVDAVQRCADERALQPVEFLQGVLRASTKAAGKHAGFSTKNYRDGVEADGSLA
jgi:uncharacterized protein YdaU (DUF1376 family)